MTRDDVGLVAAVAALLSALETERDNAHTEYRMCIVFSGGKISDDAALRIGVALERENRALKAICAVNALLLPKIEDLGYDAVQVIV